MTPAEYFTDDGKEENEVSPERIKAWKEDKQIFLSILYTCPFPLDPYTKGWILGALDEI